MQFTKMPQGYKNSPAIFQRGMGLILDGMIGKSCLSYIDDILVFGRDIEEHDKNLNLVKEHLSRYNLIINEEKSIYRVKEVEFLGYKISENKIAPLTKRSEDITNYSRPNTKKQLMRFLGLLNYDRLFIKNLSEKSKPLYELLKNDGNKLKWSKISEDLFQEIKKVYSEKLENIMPDMNKKFVLETDASVIGLGAVLKQDEKT
ncbi:Retrovirus-related Pol polyprotein from transposon 17.6 [Dictyocoela muelleri]|nr:Retrovirus-related Pol polyprotein from transposon 17.6 [Dictyocoela muelleri]